MTDTIKKKIAALLKKTVSAGCTEGEALAAAAKAAELMREHDLTETDIVIGQASARNSSKGSGARDALWRSVAHCTNTAATVKHVEGERGAELVFVGRDPGPEIAAYLVAVLNRAIDTAISDFKASAFYRRRRTDATRRAAVRDFTGGLVSRLSKRLLEIFRATIDRQAAVLAKSARDERFALARPVKAPDSATRFHDAAWSGWSAGARVNLAQGVTGKPQRATPAIPNRHPATNIGE